MRCKGCKEVIEDDSVFCRFCGVKQKRDRLTVPTPKRTANGYTAQLMVGGRRVRVTEPTIARYEAKARAVKAELLEIANNPGAVTLAAAIEDYIDSKSEVLSPSTIAGYRRMKKDRFRAVIDKRIDSIDWQRAVNEESRTVSAKTISSALSLCRAACAAKGIELPKVTLPPKVKKEKAFLTAGQVGQLLSACRGHRAEMAILLGLHSLRCSEILALTKTDCDDGLIRVRGAVVLDSARRAVFKPYGKTDKSIRSVPIMLQSLVKLVKQAPAGQLVQLTQAQLYKDINCLCRAAGVPEVGIHGLRHTFASICYNASPQIPIKTVQVLGGWNSPDVPQQIYSHLSRERLDLDTEKLLEIYSSFEKE